MSGPVKGIAAAVLSLLLTASAPAHAGGFRLAWIDLLSEDTGRWLHHDLPMLGATPGTVGLRYLYQVQAVWQLPVDNLYVGTSVASQSLHYERSFRVSLGQGDLGWFGGLHTRLFMPDGAMAGLRWKTRRARLAAGLSATTPSTWARPAFKVWSVLPTVGVSLVLGKAEPRRFKAVPQDRIEQRMKEEGDTAPGSEAAPDDSHPVDAALPTDGQEPGPDAAPAALPEGTGTEPAALPEGTGASDTDLAPPAEVEVATPTGPTAVEFESPRQVELPTSEPPPPTAVDLPTEPPPAQVIIGGGDESGDESSQAGDNSDD